MDRVLPGESLPGSLSLPDKRISQSSHGIVGIVILALFVTFGAQNFVKGPVVLLIEGVQNLWLHGLLTFIAITLGNLRGLMNLTRYPKHMQEIVKKFDMERSTDSWTKVRDLKHTLIQYLL